MYKYLILSIGGIYCFSLLRAQTVHLVKPDESLSQIADRLYPNQKTYGPGGMVEQILKLNPQIKNPDDIYLFKKIIIPDLPKQQTLKVESAPVLAPEVPRQKPVKILPKKKNIRILRKIIPTPSMNLGLNYGSRFISISQSGELGNAKIGSVFFNNLGFHIDYRRKSAGVRFEYSQYLFTNRDTTTLHQFELFGAYHGFLLGGSIIDSVVFKTQNQDIDFAKAREFNITLGGTKDVLMNHGLGARIRLNGGFNYPFFADSKSSGVTIKETSGFGVFGELTYLRPLAPIKKIPIDLNLSTRSRYSRLNQNIRWNETNSSAERTILDALFSIGFSAKF